MRIKKYEAPTIKEAIKMVKNDFGSQAIILHSKNIKKGGVMGLFGKNLVEVIAGIDINILEPKKETTAPKMTISPIQITQNNNSEIEAKTIKPKEKPAAIKQTPINTDSKINPEPTSSQIEPVIKKEQATLTEIKASLDTLKESVSKILLNHYQARSPYIIPELQSVYMGLQKCGLSQNITDQLFECLFETFNGRELKDPAKIKSFVCSFIMKKLQCGGIIEVNKTKTNYIALIGPTGVGKTTTIAKLAANYTLFEKKQVGLITIDTFRIAAIDQLKTFAEIINLNLEVVYTPEELTKAIKKMSTYEMVLVDTAGRSPNNKEHMTELQNFIKAGKGYLTNYLVLSLNSKLEDTLNAIKSFDQFGFSNIILTKADETTTYGNILDILNSVKNKNIAYLATGQNVPDDLEVADKKGICRKILQNMKGLW